MTGVLQQYSYLSYRLYCFPRPDISGPVAQRIRHLTTNQGIAGSNPARVNVKLFLTNETRHSSHYCLSSFNKLHPNILYTQTICRKPLLMQSYNWKRRHYHPNPLYYFKGKKPDIQQREYAFQFRGGDFNSHCLKDKGNITKKEK